VVDYDLISHYKDPYPIYRQLAALKEPVFMKMKQKTSMGLDGIWYVTDYEQAKKVFKNTKTISKQGAALKPREHINLFDFAVLNTDGENHERLRKIIQTVFTATAMHKIKNVIQTETEFLLSNLKTIQSFDFVSEFSDKLPLKVITQLIGFNTTKYEYIRKRSIVIADGFDSLIENDDNIAKQKQAFNEILVLVDAELKRHHREMDNSFISMLLMKQNNGELSEKEVLAMVLFMLFAGHESTAYLLSSAILLLLNHPEQLNVLRNGDEKTRANAVEEILRYESSTQRTSFRVNTSDITIGSTVIPKNSQIGIIINAVNRDPMIFQSPNDFIINRKPNRHLAFGLGTYNCIGQHLARMEVSVLIEHFWEIMPNVQLTIQGVSEADWRKNTFFRGLNTLVLKQPPLK